MTQLQKTEIDILQLRIATFEGKIAEEKSALRSGGNGPGTPKECPPIEGESRREKLLRWETTVVALKRVIAHYQTVAVK